MEKVSHEYLHCKLPHTDTEMDSSRASGPDPLVATVNTGQITSKPNWSQFKTEDGETEWDCFLQEYLTNQKRQNGTFGNSLDICINMPEEEGAGLDLLEDQPHNSESLSDVACVSNSVSTSETGTSRGDTSPKTQKPTWGPDLQYGNRSTKSNRECVNLKPSRKHSAWTDQQQSASSESVVTKRSLRIVELDKRVRMAPEQSRDQRKCTGRYDKDSVMRSNAHPSIRDMPRCYVQCGKRLSKADILKIQQQSRMRGRHKCDTCGKTFTKSTYLKLHILTHTGERPHGCKLCGKRFTQSSHLNTHMRRHTGLKPFSCPVCGKTFIDSKSCQIHQRTHTGEKPYPCFQCGQAFSQTGNLKKHMMAFHSTDGAGKPHRCTMCDRGFMSLTELNVHKLLHSGLKPHCCSECGKSFRLQSHLKDHQRVHTGAKPFSCDVCGSKFSNYTTWSRHKQIHTGNKPQDCSQCGLRFRCPGTLKTHQRTHTKEKPYTCSLPDCGKRFSHALSLQRHVRTHTGEKPFACSTCDYRAADKSSLRTHEKRHTGVKPYYCDECGKSFLIPKELNIHQRIHTGEKPYHCDICGKDFVQLSNMKTHQQTHIKRKP